MHLGVLTVALGGESLRDVLAYLEDIGVSSVELGSGGFPGEDHIDRRHLLDDGDARASLLELLDTHDMDVSALATHNNPVHPEQERATTADRELRESIELAAALDVDCVTCFSGLPGGAPDESVPNWITAPWPPEHLEAYSYQRDVVVSYWNEIASFADAHDVDIAIEMHPNMFVYEPTGLLDLRAETHDRIGANFDPSHLIWQGIDIPTAIRELGPAIHHVHAKDTKLYATHTRRKGVLDTTPYTNEPDRSWLFRSVGYGRDEAFWKHVVSTLRLVGYDGVLSIEHEDSLTSSREGLEKGLDVLNRAIFTDRPDDPHWV